MFQSALRSRSGSVAKGSVLRKKSVRRRSPRRRLGVEALEDRRLLSGTTVSPEVLNVTSGAAPRSRTDSADHSTLASAGIAFLSGDVTVAIDPRSIEGTTAEKPQSKVWQHDGAWWSVFSDSSGTYVWRLDGSAWSSVLKLTSATKFRADVTPDDEVVHIFLEKNNTSKLASIQYIPGAGGAPGVYQPWSVRPGLVSVALGDVETATIDIDGTGRMWLAYELGGAIQVRYATSQDGYATFSAPITLASGVDADDIASVISLPGAIGVMWSDQATQRFGFRLHPDGNPPEASFWSANEIPGAQSALNVGEGMADDHINLAVTTDGTLYAAVKTGYTSGFPLVGLLIRRPDGVWSSLHEVDTVGTRPIVDIDEAADRLLIIYTETEQAGNIVYRESSLATIAFGPKHVLIPGAFNNASSLKHGVSGELVVIASHEGILAGAQLFLASPSPGIAVEPVSGLVTSEAGAQASFSVRLETRPQANVTLSMSSSDLTEGTVSTASLLFTPDNWSTAQVVTVTGVDDGATDGDVAYAARLHPAESADPDYNGMDAVDVSLTNTDDDGLTVLFYFALLDDGTAGGLSVANEDIVAFGGAGFQRYFDGSDVGLGDFVLDAFAFLNETELLLSFSDPGSVPGIAGTVDDSDIVKFTATSLGENTAGTFSLYFDGSDVGLTTSAEDIDALEILPDGRLLISTRGVVSVTGVSGEDVDLLAFTPTSLGPNTLGSWALFFDGSQASLSGGGGEDVDGIAVDAQGKLHITTTGSFAVPGLSGRDEDVFVFTPSAPGSSTGIYASQYFFDGSAFGLSSQDLTDIALPFAGAGLFAAERSTGDSELASPVQGLTKRVSDGSPKTLHEGAQFHFATKAADRTTPRGGGATTGAFAAPQQFKLSSTLAAPQQFKLSSTLAAPQQFKLSSTLAAPQQFKLSSTSPAFAGLPRSAPTAPSSADGAGKSALTPSYSEGSNRFWADRDQVTNVPWDAPAYAAGTVLDWLLDLDWVT